MFLCLRALSRSTGGSSKPLWARKAARNAKNKDKTKQRNIETIQTISSDRSIDTACLLWIITTVLYQPRSGIIYFVLFFWMSGLALSSVNVEIIISWKSSIILVSTGAIIFFLYCTVLYRYIVYFEPFCSLSRKYCCDDHGILSEVYLPLLFSSTVLVACFARQVIHL